MPACDAKADPPPRRTAARRLVRRVVRRLLGQPAADRPVHDGPLSRWAAEAVDATVPKNASGNNASVR